MNYSSFSEDVDKYIQENDIPIIHKEIMAYYRDDSNKDGFSSIDDYNEEYEKMKNLNQQAFGRAIEHLKNYLKEKWKDFEILESEEQSQFINSAIVLFETQNENLGFSRNDNVQLCLKMLKFISSAPEKKEWVCGEIVQFLTSVKEMEDQQDFNNYSEDMWVQNYLPDKIYVTKLLKDSHGRNYRFLQDIFLNKLWGHDFLKRSDNKNHCSLHDTECNHFIPPKNCYFIAFPFIKENIKSNLIKSFKSKFPELTPLVAQGTIENKTALCQICEHILSSRFGVYVLAKHSVRLSWNNGMERFPNPNVLLELGLAMGAGKKFIMLVEKGTRVISDLQGYLRIEFSKIEDLPQIIENTTFSKFY